MGHCRPQCRFSFLRSRKSFQSHMNTTSFHPLGGQVHNETEQYLSSLSYGKLVLVVTNLIRPLVDNSTGRPDLCPSRIQFGRWLTGGQGYPGVVIQFLLEISSTQGILQDALLDAALLNISPFLKPPWSASRIYGDVYRKMHSWPWTKHAPVHHQHTIALVQLIRSGGLDAVVITWDDQGIAIQNCVHFLQPRFT
ncbi:hypothetical protein B0H14DRAFT_1065264 [Mycena olivaceomarginata]|nr:hypothetical protein B0H14DRAFT_1065264 [Mycena olivaceomarginata]